MAEETEMAVEVDKNWRIRKEISWPTLIALVAQAAVLIWITAGAAADTRAALEQQSKRLDKLEKVDSENRLTRLEAQSEATKALLERIDTAISHLDSKLDRVIERAK